MAFLIHLYHEGVDIWNPLFVRGSVTKILTFCRPQSLARSWSQSSSPDLAKPSGSKLPSLLFSAPSLRISSFLDTFRYLPDGTVAISLW